MSGIPMLWMPLCGETWASTAAAFLGMWAVMTAAMMLPSVAPVLWRYHQAVGKAGGPRPASRTALVAAGYFCMWATLGLAVFPPGAALGAALMRHPALAHAVPGAAGAVVMAAGAVQFTEWKAHRLACCRNADGGNLPATFGTAWRYGVRLGLRCISCCAGPTAILLAVGIMDLRAMAAVTGAITAERLAPAGERIARATGAVAVVAGLFMMVRATGP